MVNTIITNSCFKFSVQNNFINGNNNGRGVNLQPVVSCVRLSHNVAHGGVKVVMLMVPCLSCRAGFMR